MTKEQYKIFRSKLNFSYSYKALIQELCIDIFLLAGIFYLITLPSAFAYLAALPIALIMIRNVSVMHEAVHGLSHPHSGINYALGLISGTICLLPFHLWKKIHLEHHFWAGNFNKDPSLEIMKRYPTSSPFLKAFLSFSWKTRLPLTALGQYIVFWAHSVVGVIKNHKQGLLWLNMIIPVAIWGVVMANLNTQQLGVLALGIFLYLMIFEAVNFPHHVGLYLEDSETARRPVWQQYEITRTSRYTPWIERLSILNFNYHAEHHIFPDLPWHQLPQAHKLIQESEVKASTIVIEAGWLTEKRKDSFVSYLRPDVYEKEKTKKAA